MPTARLQIASKNAKPADSRITARLLSDFKRLMATGELTPGTKLAPERELAKKFGVNRGSLRQV
jgi:DNA-binding FadR family transcriptional regulator